MAEEILLVLSTWPDLDRARAAARTFIDEELAACANLVPQIESIYRWQGAIETSTEVLMLIKTTAPRYRMLEARLQELHSYQVPEILCFRAEGGLPAYLGWVKDSCATTHRV